MLSDPGSISRFWSSFLKLGKRQAVSLTDSLQSVMAVMINRDKELWMQTNYYKRLEGHGLVTIKVQ